MGWDGSPDYGDNNNTSKADEAQWCYNGGDGWYGIGMVSGAKNQAGEFLIVLF